MKKEFEASPFDLYDFFGYLMPGIVACIGIFFYFPWEKSKISPYLEQSVWKEWPFLLGLIVFSMVVTVIYLIGHVVASLSSLLIEKFFVQRTTAYPIYKLLEEDLRNTDIVDRSKKAKRKSTFVFFYILSFCISMYKIPYVLPIIVLLLSLSILYARNRTSIKISSWSEQLFRYISAYISITLAINDKFDPEFQNKFREAVKREFRLNKTTRDVYWLCYMYVINKSNLDYQLLSSWLRLYSMMRNITVSIYILYLIHSISSEFTFLNWGISVFLFVIASVTFLRYYYIYYNYYSKYLFRSFVRLSEERMFLSEDLNNRHNLK